MINPAALPFNSGAINWTTATTDTNNNPTCDSSSNTAGAKFGVWFSFTPTVSATYTLAQTASQDTATSVWTGACGVGQTPVACSDPETSTVAMTAGTTYYILVSKWNASTATGTITFTLGLPGACCTTASGVCTVVLSTACTASGTVFTAGAACNTTICPVPPPPANDECAAAAVIAPFAGLSTTVNGSNATATSSTGAGIPSGCALSSPGYKDVYYTYTPAAGQGGPHAFSLCSTTPSFDTVLTVHSGCPATSANTLQCNDDGCTGGAGASAITGLNLTENVTYIIRVANYSSTSTIGGPFTLVVSREPTGACCTGTTCAILAQSACTSGGGTFNGASACTTGFCSNGACCNTSTGACSITDQASCTGNWLGLFTVCGPTNPCGVACCNAATGACSVALSGACPSGTTQLGTQSCTIPSNPCPQPPPPANDNCPGTALTLGTPATGTTAFATGSAISAACTGTSRDVYYSFTNSSGSSGSYTITITPTNSTGVGTVISTVCPPAVSGDILACNTSSTAVYTISVNVNNGQTIYIRLADFSETTAATFTVQIDLSAPTGSCCTVATGACSVTTQAACTQTWTQGAACDTTICPLPPPPANDDCANAQALQLNVAFTGNNSTATGTATEGPAPSCQTSIWKSVWFSFTAPSNDVFGFTACGSSFDTVLTVYGGTCTSFGTQVGCDDDACDGVTPAGSTLASVIAPVALTQGQTYLIRLSGYSTSSASGNYTLTVTGTAPPVGGVCCRGVTCTTGLTAGTCTDVASNGVTITASFVSASADCNAAGVLTQPCCYGNFDRSADGVQVADIFAFLSAFFANSPYAVQQSTSGGADPTGTPGVPDIFNFLSSWFGAGGCV